MKEITNIEPTIVDGEVKKITVSYSSGDPVVFVPEVVTVTDAEVVAEPEAPVEASDEVIAQVVAAE